MTRTDGIRGWLIAVAVIVLVGGFYPIFLLADAADRAGRANNARAAGYDYIADPLYAEVAGRFLAATALLALIAGIATTSFIARSVIVRLAAERDELAAALPETADVG